MPLLIYNRAMELWHNFSAAEINMMPAKKGGGGTLAAKSATKKNALNVANRTMFIGDNLPVLDNLNSNSVDLIYLDPPFNSNRNYSAPVGSKAAGASFKDAWTLSDIDHAWIDVIAADNKPMADLIDGIGKVNGKGDKSYLIFMARRLLEMRRVLKETGSIYLHCDPTMSHALKLLMDCIFGKRNFRNEIIWCYTGPSNVNKHFPRKHDVILFYAKSPLSIFNKDAVRVPYKSGIGIGKGGKADSIFRSGDNAKRIAQLLRIGKVPFDWFADDYLTNISAWKKERTGYPTQKPLALLERIIKASSNEDDVILDPFCGCATACVAAERLGRQWVGIDISNKATDLIRQRLQAEEFLWKKVGKGRHIIPRTDLPVRSDIAEKFVNPQRYKATLYGVQGGYCTGCKKHFEPRQMDVDHILPKTRGGQDIKKNLQLLCANCNRVKGGRDMLYLRMQLKKQGII